MSRFALLAVASFGLTIGLTYEGATLAIHGLEALVGIGIPRLITSGLIQLALAALLLNLAWLTLGGARQQLAIARVIRARDRQARPNGH